MCEWVNERVKRELYHPTCAGWGFLLSWCRLGASSRRSYPFSSVAPWNGSQRGCAQGWGWGQMRGRAEGGKKPVTIQKRKKKAVSKPEELWINRNNWNLHNGQQSNKRSKQILTISEKTHTKKHDRKNHFNLFLWTELDLSQLFITFVFPPQSLLHIVQTEHLKHLW